MKSTPRIPSDRVDGFTLVEVMIATTMLALMITLFMSVYMDLSEITFTSDAKNLINRDIRSVTQQMSQNAREASYFALYRSFETEDRDQFSDQLDDGKSGDFVVFVYLGLPTGTTYVSERPIEKIIGYYREISDPDDPDATGPVYCFNLTITGSDQEKQLETLLPSYATFGTHRQILEVAQGLANGDLFLNSWGKALMVNFKIIHGNDAKEITDTYNFTISPRGMQQ